VFLHLHGSKEVLRSRTEGRSGHFMPPALLFDTITQAKDLPVRTPLIRRMLRAAGR
jgi:beta-N-acetylhexosaminidase